jgi:ABC-type transporter Mla maintaining outer membrane lipid asymmetry ATPase subunit MlaF
MIKMSWRQIITQMRFSDGFVLIVQQACLALGAYQRECTIPLARKHQHSGALSSQSVAPGILQPLYVVEIVRYAALDRVGLSRFAGAFPRELSGGMKMRVSIARALVTRPAILMLDEPFAALDEITRFRLNDDLLRLQGELAATIVFVTHSVFESVYLSSRICVFSNRPGRVTHEIVIDAPAPRDAGFRASALFGQTCQQASAALERAYGLEGTT